MGGCRVIRVMVLRQANRVAGRVGEAGMAAAGVGAVAGRAAEAVVRCRRVARDT